MTKINALLTLAGLSTKEASAFLRVKPETVYSWPGGAKPRAKTERALCDLIAHQEAQAADLVRLAKECGISVLILREPADDAAAEKQGYPCVGAWWAMAARVAAIYPLTIVNMT